MSQRRQAQRAQDKEKKKATKAAAAVDTRTPAQKRADTIAAKKAAEKQS